MSHWSPKGKTSHAFGYASALPAWHSHPSVPVSANPTSGTEIKNKVQPSSPSWVSSWDPQYLDLHQALTSCQEHSYVAKAGKCPGSMEQAIQESVGRNSRYILPPLGLLLSPLHPSQMSLLSPALSYLPTFPHTLDSGFLESPLQCSCTSRPISLPFNVVYVICFPREPLFFP